MEQYFDMTMLTTLSGCVLAVCILVQNLKEPVDYVIKLLFNKSLPTKYLTFIVSTILYSLVTYFNSGIKTGEDVLLVVLNSFIVSGVACKSTETIMNKNKGKSEGSLVSEVIKSEVEKVNKDKNILKI